MGPKNDLKPDQTTPAEPATPAPKKRFHILKLEERIAPKKGGNSNNKNCCPTGIDQGCCGGSGSIY